MSYLSTGPGMDQQIRNSFRTTGILLVLIGLVAMLLPQAVSIVLSVFIGSLLILSGLVVAWGTWAGYRASAMTWLKPFVLILIGLLIVFNPAAVAAALGLLLVIYFLLTGFASITFALDLRPHGGWPWLLLNGLLSTTLGIVFLVGWPFSSVALIGLLVGISLVFEGITLLAVSRAMNTPG